jgi:pimeloyl-ACP methyl ester carboxylesterase
VLRFHWAHTEFEANFSQIIVILQDIGRGPLVKVHQGRAVQSSHHSEETHRGGDSGANGANPEASLLLWQESEKGNAMKAKIACVLFMFACPLAAQEAGPPWKVPEGLKTINVNNYPLAYREEGQGDPVVLVHGSMLDYRTWNVVVPELAKKHRVLALSLRHYYPEKWDGKGEDFSITQHASDVAAFVRALKLGTVHLVGHSRGGAVTLTVARLHPDVIRSLVLMDASGLESLLPKTTEGESAAQGGMAMRKAVKERIEAGDKEKAAEIFLEFAVPGMWATLPPERKQIFYDNIGTGIVVEGRPDVKCADIAKFSFPVGLITAEKSPKRYSEMFAAISGTASATASPTTSSPSCRGSPA